MGFTSTLTRRSGAAAAGRVADDPPDGIADGNCDKFLAGLERDHRHAPRRGIDLVERAIGGAAGQGGQHCLPKVRLRAADECMHGFVLTSSGVAAKLTSLAVPACLPKA